MAVNSRIHILAHHGTLYIRLIGNFTNASADEMITAIEARYDEFAKIIIDTSGISSAFPVDADAVDTAVEAIDPLTDIAILEKCDHWIN
jgi:hypothetical protein